MIRPGQVCHVVTYLNVLVLIMTEQRLDPAPATFQNLIKTNHHHPGTIYLSHSHLIHPLRECLVLLEQLLYLVYQSVVLLLLGHKVLLNLHLLFPHFHLLGQLGLYDCLGVLHSLQYIIQLRHELERYLRHCVKYCSNVPRI